MKVGRFAGVGAMLLALFLSTASAKANAFDQVPSDALLALKIKNLDAVSKKIAKWAKDIGFDQQDPAWADPLSAIAEKAHLGKGVNRGGDLVIVMLDPQQFGGEESKSVLVLVPVSDYKAFVSNFKATADEGAGITKATPHEGNEDVFVANWGQYAALSPNKDVVTKKPTGLKVAGFAAKESESKDALLYVNMSAVKAKLLPELKNGRQMLLDMVEGALGGQGEAGKKYTPLAKAAVNQIVNIAEEFLNDSTSATVGLNITSGGITATVASDFSPTSNIGKMALQTKGTSASMLTGLPARKYFMFAGSEGNTEVMKKLVADLFDPIIKELNAVPDTKKFAEALESAKAAYGSMTGSSVGLVAPQGALGQESVIQQVAVIRGDAKVIQASQRQMLATMNDLMAMFPQQGGMKSSFELKKDSKTVGGVKLDEFKTNMVFPEDDAPAQQAKQMMEFIYGPNGMTGVMGPVNDKLLISVQGGSDELLADTITAAKANADTLGAMAGVREVAAELPKERAIVAYVDVGNIVSTTLRYMKGAGAGIPNVKIPADLPPIGVTGGTDGTAVRMDLHIPNRLVQGLYASYMEAERQNRNPKDGL